MLKSRVRNVTVHMYSLRKVPTNDHSKRHTNSCRESSHQGFCDGMPPFRHCLASCMLSESNRNWPAIKLAFLASPPQRLTSITSREALMRVRTSINCFKTKVGASGDDEMDNLVLVAPFGGIRPGSLRLIS